MIRASQASDCAHQKRLVDWRLLLNTCLTRRMSSSRHSYYGFARKLSVQSRSMDAEIVVDGAVSYPWVDGDTAILEILPEDALTTVKF